MLTSLAYSNDDSLLIRIFEALTQEYHSPSINIHFVDKVFLTKRFDNSVESCEVHPWLNESSFTTF